MNWKETEKDLVEMRNVAGEIKGSYGGYENSLRKGQKTLYIHYDYAGIENWAKGTWKTNKLGTKDTRNFMIPLRIN